MNSTNPIGYYIGAAGVDSSENNLARRVGLLFEMPMLLAAFWIFLVWSERPGHLQGVQSNAYDLTLWGLFVFETLLITLLVNEKVHYLKGNWLNLVVILFGLPILIGWDVNLGALRVLRIVVIFTLLLHISSGVRRMLTRNELGMTLSASAIVIVMSGIMMAALDEGIATPWDGIWWAWVTMTTVGYGDVVPLSPQGRMFGSLIILAGLVLTSIFTASIAAHFISQREEEPGSAEAEIKDKLDALTRKTERMEAKLDQLLKKGD